MLFHPGSARKRSPYRDGISVLEGMVAGVIVIVGVVATTISLRHISKARAGIEATNAIDRIDGFLKKVLQSRIANYFKATAGACDQAGLLATLTFDSPSGLRITPIDPSTLVVSPLDGPRAKLALERCRTQQTAYSGAAIASAPLIHFCVRVQPVPGDAEAAESFGGLEQVFGEFVFQVVDARNGAPYSCSAFASPVPWATATLTYGFYWNGADHTPRTSFASALLGTL
jgi:hypothetical protein